MATSQYGEASDRCDSSFEIIPNSPSPKFSVQEILDDYYDASHTTFGSSGGIDATTAANAVLAEISNGMPFSGKEFHMNRNNNNEYYHMNGGREHARDTNSTDQEIASNEVQNNLSEHSQESVSGESTSNNSGVQYETNSECSMDSSDSSDSSSSISIREEVPQLPQDQLNKGNAETSQKNCTPDDPTRSTYADDLIQPRIVDISSPNEESSKRSFHKMRHEKNICSSPTPMERNSNRDGDQAKKAFLKKGARREPSALHRFQNESQTTNSPKLSGRLSHTEEEKKKKLQELERMQEKQVEDLKKRMERRQCAREEIRLRNQGCKVQVADNVNQKKQIEKAKKLEGVEEKKNGNCPAVSDSKSDEAASSCADSDSDSDSDSDLEMSCNDKPNGLPSDQGMKQLLEHSSIRKQDDGKRNVAYRRRKLTSGRNRKVIAKKNVTKSPLRGQKQFGKNAKNSLEKKSRSPEMEEQWQVIKSMRKRQEAALRSAEMEREEVRSWAASEREKLNKWREHQRTLIQKEKQRILNDTMITQRRKRKEQLEGSAAEASITSQKQARDEIENLKAIIHKQKIDADATKARHRLNEKRLRDMITERDQKICMFKEEVEIARERIESLEIKRNSLIQERDANVASHKKELKKIKKKMKKEKESLAAHVPEEHTQSSTGELGHVRNLPSSEIFDPSPTKKGPTLNAETKTHEDEGNSKENKTSDKLPAPSSSPCEVEPSTNHDEDIHMPTSNQYDGNDKEKQDAEAIRVISSNQDFINEPTEDWLQRHLKGLKNNGEQNQWEDSNTLPDTEGNSLPFYTPTKGKIYNPAKYSGHVETPKVDQQMMEPAHTHNSNAHQIADVSSPLQQKTKERRGMNGQRVITYRNGTQKEIFPDGTSIVRFTNGDIKTSYGNIGIVVYYYAEAKTSHTTYPDGAELFEFSSGQSEKHFPDGRKDVRFPDGTQQFFFSNGGCETVYADGLKVVEGQNGAKQIVNF